MFEGSFYQEEREEKKIFWDVRGKERMLNRNHLKLRV